MPGHCCLCMCRSLCGMDSALQPYHLACILQWTVENIRSRTETMVSPSFQAGLYRWRVLLHPQGRQGTNASRPGEPVASMIRCAGHLAAVSWPTGQVPCTLVRTVHRCSYLGPGGQPKSSSATHLPLLLAGYVAADLELLGAGLPAGWRVQACTRVELTNSKDPALAIKMKGAPNVVPSLLWLHGVLSAVPTTAHVTPH